MRHNYIMVMVDKDHRFKVQFTPDVKAYFTDETLPDKIKYALASRGLYIIFSSSMLRGRNEEEEGAYQLMFSEQEITELMRDAGVGSK